MRLTPLLAAALVATTLSCTLRSEAVLRADGQLDLAATVVWAPEVDRVWGSLHELDPSLPAKPLGPAQVAQQLPPGAEVTAIDHGLRIKTRASQPTKEIPGLTLTSTRGTWTLDRAGLRRWLVASGWGESSVLDALVPAPGVPITEAEYRDLLVFFLGDQLTDAAARALLDGSKVVFTVEAPRAITRAEGAVIEGRRATWTWPLVRLLFLDPPVTLSWSF